MSRAFADVWANSELESADDYGLPGQFVVVICNEVAFLRLR